MLVRSWTTDPLVGLQRPGQLAVADVDRDHLARPVSQQHVGEAAGRRAGVQAAAARRPPARPARRPRARPRACVRRGTRSPDGPGRRATTIATSVVTAGGGLGGGAAGDRHPPGGDQLAGVLAGAGQPPPDQLGVQPQTRGAPRLLQAGSRSAVQRLRAASRGPPRRRPTCSSTGRRVEGIHAGQHLVDGRIAGAQHVAGGLVGASSPWSGRSSSYSSGASVMTASLPVSGELIGLRRPTPSVSTGSPDASRWAQAAVAATRHQSPAEPVPAPRAARRVRRRASRRSSAEPSPDSGTTWASRRPPRSAARGRSDAAPPAWRPGRPAR